MRPRPHPRPRKTGLARFVTTLGLLCAVLLVIAGLVIVGFFVLGAVAMSNHGSNK